MQTILLIENDPASLTAHSLLLRCLQYNVLEATDREDAWCACRDHVGPVHLLLTEAIPGDENLSQFVADLKILCPQIRALFVSGEAHIRMADVPCDYACLHKPLRASALADAITELLDHQEKMAVACA